MTLLYNVALCLGLTYVFLPIFFLWLCLSLRRQSGSMDLEKKKKREG